MSLASVFIMLDAQTIQMCKMEEAAGEKGSYGRQILYKTLAQAIISPLVPNLYCKDNLEDFSFLDRVADGQDHIHNWIHKLCGTISNL